MSDGVHTAMNAVQPACLGPAQTASLSDAGSLELRERDHSVLVGREASNEGVRSGVGDFPTHGGG
jgi:hypothetical protein